MAENDTNTEILNDDAEMLTVSEIRFCIEDQFLIITLAQGRTKKREI